MSWGNAFARHGEVSEQAGPHGQAVVRPPPRAIAATPGLVCLSTWRCLLTTSASDFPVSAPQRADLVHPREPTAPNVRLAATLGDHVALISHSVRAPLATAGGRRSRCNPSKWLPTRPAYVSYGRPPPQASTFRSAAGCRKASQRIATPTACPAFHALADGVRHRCRGGGDRQPVVRPPAWRARCEPR